MYRAALVVRDLVLCHHIAECSVKAVAGLFVYTLISTSSLPVHIKLTALLTESNLFSIEW